MRGFGYSKYETPIQNLKDIATDIQLFLTKLLKYEKFYIAGHQLGSVVGLMVANMMSSQCLGVMGFSPLPIYGLELPDHPKPESIDDILKLKEY